MVVAEIVSSMDAEDLSQDQICDKSIMGLVDETADLGTRCLGQGTNQIVEDTREQN